MPTLGLFLVFRIRVMSIDTSVHAVSRSASLPPPHLVCAPPRSVGWTKLRRGLNKLSFMNQCQGSQWSNNWALLSVIVIILSLFGEVSGPSLCHCRHSIIVWLCHCHPSIIVWGRIRPIPVIILSLFGEESGPSLSLSSFYHCSGRNQALLFVIFGEQSGPSLRHCRHSMIVWLCHCHHSIIVWGAIRPLHISCFTALKAWAQKTIKWALCGSTRLVLVQYDQ